MFQISRIAVIIVIVRKVVSTTCLYLALLPYLVLVLFGTVPHQHSHYGQSIAFSASLGRPVPAGVPLLTSSAGYTGGDSCPICQWHTATSSCAHIAIPTHQYSAYVPVAAVTVDTIVPAPQYSTSAPRAPPTRHN